jgi:transcriptional regulator with XRE-family HTH domain
MITPMPATDRSLSRGTRRAERALQALGDELRERRVGAGLTQLQIASAARMSRSRYTRVELARVRHLSVLDASRIASVLGLDLHVRVYPGGDPIRDAAQARRLARLLGHCASPLKYRTDVPLPQRADQPTEQRAWDAVIWGDHGRTAIEVEMRIRDLQQMTRRQAMKRRDDPVDSFLLVVADTPANRRVLTEHGTLLPDLPRLKTARVLRMLEDGTRPPSGVVLL